MTKSLIEQIAETPQYYWTAAKTMASFPLFANQGFHSELTTAASLYLTWSAFVELGTMMIRVSDKNDFCGIREYAGKQPWEIAFLRAYVRLFKEKD